MASINPFDLTGKVIVVTGGSRGIGASLARGIGEAGATVFALGRSAVPDEPLGGDMLDITYLVADIRRDGDNIIRRIGHEAGRIDGLVNCAGVSLPQAGPGSEASRFRDTVELNLSCTYDLCAAAGAFMTAGGSIVNVTSIGSFLGFPGNPGYVSSKGGLRMLTRALAVDYGSRGIRVNALVPGYVRTAMTLGSYKDMKEHERRRAHTCLGRWAEPEDMVGATVFLLSKASSYVTGSDLVVDGGWTAKGLI